MAKIPNLNDLLPPELQEMDAQSANAYFDTPLLFHSSRLVQGKRGAYYRIDVTLPDSEEHFVLACGAAQVNAVMQWALETHSFPFMGQFKQAGQAIILKGI